MTPIDVNGQERGRDSELLDMVGELSKAERFQVAQLAQLMLGKRIKSGNSKESEEKIIGTCR